MTGTRRDPQHRPTGPDDPDGPAARRVPYDSDIAEALLGAAMLSKAALATLVTETRPDDFYDPAHARLARVLTDAFEAGHEVDATLVAHDLEQRGWLDEHLDQGRLISIIGSVPATTSAPRYAAIVHEAATLRRLIEEGERIVELGYAGGDAHEAVVAAQARLGHVAANNGARSYSTLEVADADALLGGNLDPPDADFLARSDGLNLLYAGKMHVFQAEPSTGKTWLALQAVKEVLDLGGAAVYVDWEDSARGILGRLLALGATPAQIRERFQYLQPTGPFGQAEKLVIEEILGRLNPDVVILDGVAEALARDGLDEDRAADVVAWGEKLPRWLSRTGAAVVMLDHVAKSADDRGRWARGSGAKLGMVDGAAYSLKTSTGFSRSKAGAMRVVIAKDRPGGVGSIGETAAMVTIEPAADGEVVTLKVEPDTAAKHPSDTWKPTRLMARVSEEVATSATALTASAVKAMIHGSKPKLVAEAIARLVAEGYLRETKRGSSTFLVHVKPYHGDDGHAPDPPPPPDPELFDVTDQAVDLEEWKNRNL